MNTRMRFSILAVVTTLLLLFSGCAVGSTSQPNEQDMQVDWVAFALSPEDFTSAITDNTDFVQRPVEKDTIIQFEDSASSITLTAMLYSGEITTVVFQVQGIGRAEDDKDVYVAKLNTVVSIVLGADTDCDPAIFSEAQSLNVPGATVQSTIEPNDITIMIVPKS